MEHDPFRRLMVTGTSRRNLLISGGAGAAGLTGLRDRRAFGDFVWAAPATPVGTPVATPRARGAGGFPVPVINLAALGPLPFGDLADFAIGEQEMILTPVGIGQYTYLPSAAMAAFRDSGFDIAFLTVLAKRPTASDQPIGDRAISMLTVVASRRTSDWSALFEKSASTASDSVSVGDRAISWEFEAEGYYASSSVASGRSLVFSHGPFAFLITVSDTSGNQPTTDEIVAIASGVDSLVTGVLAGKRTPALAAVFPAAGMAGFVRDTIAMPLLALDGDAVPNQYRVLDPAVYHPILELGGSIMSVSYNFTDDRGRDLVISAYRPEIARRVKYLRTSATITCELYVFPPEADLAPLQSSFDDFLSARFSDWDISPASSALSG